VLDSAMQFDSAMQQDLLNRANLTYSTSKLDNLLYLKLILLTALCSISCCTVKWLFALFWRFPALLASIDASSSARSCTRIRAS
jgi:hypothetical protein